MGSEAIIDVTITDATVTPAGSAAGSPAARAAPLHIVGVKAVLESRELILRGPLRRVLPLSDITDVATDGDGLRFRHDNQRYELILGPAAAARWAKKIVTPPPTLAAKLGISAERPALVIGPVTDSELAAALAGTSVSPGSSVSAETSAPVAPESTRADSAARGTHHIPDSIPTDIPVVAVAEVDDPAALATALAGLPAAMPIWVVYRKGRAAFGEAPIRDRMRSQGFTDTKTSAVSETRSALRFSPRQRADGLSPGG
jgi:hypothetical protein